MNKVSAIIITQNEEALIGRCLGSLLWVDEILVVDGGSTDRTLEICRDPGAPWASKIRLIERPWTGFREQREFALKSAAHDWVFVIDSDEACTPDLAHKLQELLENNPPRRAYKIRRVEFFAGKLIRHGIGNPNYQDRFFHRTGIRYTNDVHEYPVFLSEPGWIEEPILHSPHLEAFRFVDKMNRYTSVEAQDRYNQGMRTNWFRILGAFPAMFLKNYFYYKGYKDRGHGVVLSILEGISRAVRHIKIWQIQNSEARPKTIERPKSETIKASGDDARKY